MRKEFEKSVRNKGGHSFVHGWLQFAVQERERERPFSINFWPAAEFDARAPIVNRTFFRRTFEGNIVSVKMQHSICPSFSTIFYFSRTFFSFFFFFFFFFFFSVPLLFTRVPTPGLKVWKSVFSKLR